MPIDPNARALYRACAPDVSLDVTEDEGRQYYIDFSSVREGQVIEDVCKKIVLGSGQGQLPDIHRSYRMRQIN